MQMQVIKNAKVINERGQLEDKHIVIADGLIQSVASDIAALPEMDDNVQLIDAEGKLVTPGFIDMHVHLREPGYEHKETIESGSRSAVKGGFTTIACMPNTRPVTDSPETVKLVP
ncbi:amidohydrolase family protein, partial [Clostridium perfringens]